MNAMAILGILTCEILELEIAAIVSDDRQISRITIVDDINAQHLIETIETRGLHFVHRIPHLSVFDPERTGYEVLIRVLKVGLHRHRDILRKCLKQGAGHMDRFIDALLLGYGQCGGALAEPTDIIDIHCPVLYPKDNAYPVADCVGLYFNGNEEYYREQRRVAGTYYLTPGWCRHWPDMFGKADDNHPKKISSRLCRRMLRGYKRLLVIHSPVLNQMEIEAPVHDLEKLSGLDVEERKGSIQPLEKSYQEAKKILGLLP